MPPVGRPRAKGTKRAERSGAVRPPVGRPREGDGRGGRDEENAPTAFSSSGDKTRFSEGKTIRVFGAVAMPPVGRPRAMAGGMGQNPSPRKPVAATVRLQFR